MRSLSAVIVVLLALAIIAGCGENPPGALEPREEKAAGLTAFRITLHEDLWNRTGADDYEGTFPPIKGKITKRGDGVITVELSGPQTSDLLRKLTEYGWKQNFLDSTHNRAEARRLYNAITPAIDRIKATPRAGDPVPEVIVDDDIPASTAPTTPRVTPQATASASR